MIAKIIVAIKSIYKVYYYFKFKINELINEWHTTVPQYTNMFASLGKFINIQTRLPKNLIKLQKNMLNN